MPENFNPKNPEYKKVEDLPEEQQPRFKNIEGGGFINQEALSEEDAWEESIKIETLAEKCNMSETHFRRLFTEYMNMTPVDYINMIRVQMACEQMKKTNDSMNEVAMKSGFITTSTFNRNFKRIVGVTPYQWKKTPENYESKLLQFHISVAKGW